MFKEISKKPERKPAYNSIIKKEKIRSDINKELIQREIDNNTFLEEINLSSYKLADSGRSGNPVLLGSDWVYKLINPSHEREYKWETDSAIEMSMEGIPVLFYKALGIRNVILPGGKKSKSAVIMMRKGQGKTYMLPKQGHKTSFINDVSKKYKNDKIQLTNLRRTFDLASNFGLNDPQFIYDIELNDVQFMDTHGGGAKGGGHCRDIVNALDEMLEKL